jgi:tight adherence protein B
VIALVAGAAAAGAVIGLGARPPLRRRPGEVAADPPASLTEAVQYVAAAATRVLDRLRPSRRLARRDAQLPDALDRVASALRAGQALGPALVEVAESLPDPLGPELRQVAVAFTHGASVASASAAWAQRPGASADVRLVAAALALGADAGGEVARAVDRVGTTLRERRERQAEVRSLAIQARTSAGVLAVTPLAFTALVTTIEPGAAVFLLTTPLGLACLVLGLGLVGLGATWMARITRSAV